MTTTKDRLKAFLTFKKIGRNKFEEMINVSTGYMSSKGVSITSDALEKTCFLFPELNAEWLLTGKGEMIESNMSHSISGGGSVNARYSGSFNDVRTHIGNNIKSDAESIELEMLKKENDSLKRELALKNELLAEKERLIKMILKE